LTAQSSLTATAVARPAGSGDRASRTKSPAKQIGPDRPAEVDFEIIGIPALQVSVKDSTDPVALSKRTTYTIRVKNTGTLAATKVIVSAETPELVATRELKMKPVKATGPGSPGRIDRNLVTFPPIDSLAPNAEATFVIEVEALMSGDARFRVEVRGGLLSQPLRAEEPTRILDPESRPPGE